MIFSDVGCLTIRLSDGWRLTPLRPSYPFAKIDGRTAIGIAKAFLFTIYKKEKLANCNPEGLAF